MEPKISFLIATKNRADIIDDTIKSLLDQEVGEWEAVIVDDHSDDGTRGIIDGFNDERLRYFILPERHGSGASCARNFAVIQARAPIVAIMDSDDLAYPNRTRVTMEAFAQNPGADIFYANVEVWEEKTGIIRDRKTPFVPFSLERLKESNFIPHPTVAMKKQILLDNPYNQFFRIAEDYELYTRLATQAKIFIYSRKKILRYRLSDKNISIGADKAELTEYYGALVRMVRGWIPFDPSLISKIEKQEGRLK